MAEAVDQVGHLLGVVAAAQEGGVELLLIGGADEIDQFLFLGGLLVCLFGLGFLVQLVLPAFLFEGQTGGLMIVAAQEGDFAVELAEPLPAFFGGGVLLSEFGKQAVKLGGEDEAEAVGEVVAGGVVSEVVGVFGEVEGGLAGFLAAEPLGVAGVAPVGEVLLGDEGTVEVLVNDLPGFGLSVEPLEDVLAGEAIFEAEAELIAEGFGEAGDFAGGGHTSAGFGVWNAERRTCFSPLRPEA